MKALSFSLKKCKLKKAFREIAPKFDEISGFYNNFCMALDEVFDIEFAAELGDLVADLFEKYFNLHEFLNSAIFIV